MIDESCDAYAGMAGRRHGGRTTNSPRFLNRATKDLQQSEIRDMDFIHYREVVSQCEFYPS
jgi:hypothetical protein